MKARAYAKVNLALAVYRPSADGYHPLRGLFQSVSLHDTVEVRLSDGDAVSVSSDEAPADETNIAWVALETVRRALQQRNPMALSITKRIPSGAGLGGGSADAAAVIGLLTQSGTLDDEVVAEIARSLGADVPFALEGGTALVRGRGDLIDPMETLSDFALAVVVPPFSLSTPEVFREWDRLDGPIGDPVVDSDLPPALRNAEPIRNDLYPAAVSLDRRIAEWRDELMGLWGTTVCMTGSGSGLFAFFSSTDEALSAADAVTVPTRACDAVELVSRGWDRVVD